MPFETRAADGGLFHVVNGRRVWISEPTDRLCQGCLDWARLLNPRAGGPGEPPGRPAAVERARRRSADKARSRLKTSKKPKR